MRVRLKVRWGSHLQGSVVSVSRERAFALEEAGFGGILAEDRPKQEKTTKPKGKK